jgi:hypothetical protein
VELKCSKFIFVSHIVDNGVRRRTRGALVAPLAGLGRPKIECF